MSRFLVDDVVVTKEGVICVNWDTGRTFIVTQPDVICWLLSRNCYCAPNWMKYFLIHNKEHVSKVEVLNKKNNFAMIVKDFNKDMDFYNLSYQSLKKFLDYAEEHNYSLAPFFRKVTTDSAGLFDFLASNNLPITVNGNILAFKVLTFIPEKKVLVDCYTKQVVQQVGDIVSMPRYMVDTDRKNHCSNGLHVCTKDYLKTWCPNSSTVLTLVKVAPEDVYAVPDDLMYKMRCCKYQILGIIPKDEASDVLSGRNTNTPVFNKLFENALNEKFTGVNNAVELSARTVHSTKDISITHVHSFALDGVAQTQVSNPTFVEECSENASQKLLKSIQFIDALRRGIAVENEEKYLKRLKKLKKKVSWKALKVEDSLQRKIQRRWKKYGIN